MFKSMYESLDLPVLTVTTFGDICSKKSRGIVIHRVSTNLANLLTYNLACAVGLSDKDACPREFHGSEELYDFDNGIGKLSLMKQILDNKDDKKWSEIINRCEKNKKIHQKPKKSYMFLEDDLLMEGGCIENNKSNWTQFRNITYMNRLDRVAYSWQSILG